MQCNGQFGCTIIIKILGKLPDGPLHSLLRSIIRAHWRRTWRITVRIYNNAITKVTKVVPNHTNSDAPGIQYLGKYLEN